MQCPRCQAEASPQTRFCGQCGQPLEIPASPLSNYTPPYLATQFRQSHAAMLGERRRVTVMFCDIVGSTALAERLGPDRMHRVLEDFFRLALREVHRFEGMINQFLGDGFLALFGAPIANEDHARRAVLAGWALQAALRDASGAQDATPMQVRMGINTGLVVIGAIGDNLRLDYTAVGDTVNVAARLQAFAGPGAICVGETTYRAIRDVVTTVPRGEHVFKGKTDAIRVFEVTANTPGAVPSDGLSVPSLVGRGRELARLRSRVDDLLAGRGTAVTLVGEPGIGKTRLVRELRLATRDMPLRWIAAGCTPLGTSTSFGPLTAILTELCGLARPDDAATAWSKVDRTLHGLGAAVADATAPYIATLLAIPVPEAMSHRVRFLTPEAMGRQVHLAVTRVLEALTSAGPIVVSFEDAHWSDDSSLQLLEHLVGRVTTVPLLVIVTTRTGRPTGRRLFDAGLVAQLADRYEDMALAPLAPEDSARLAERFLAWSMPRGLRDVLVERSGGNPFFLRELLRSLIEQGVLAPSAGSDPWSLRRDPRELPIPDSIEGIVATRIDRLDKQARHVLKVAAVVGPRVTSSLLEHVVPDAAPHLHTLERAGLLEARPPATGEWTFADATVREVAYDMILVPERQELHRRTAEAMEGIAEPHPAAEQIAMLAHHYAEADCWDRAREYLLRAAEHARRVTGNAEALACYRRAVDACARTLGDRWDPLERAHLERQIAESLYLQGDPAPAFEHLQRAAMVMTGRRLPVAKRDVRLGILREGLRQLRRASRPTTPTDPVGDERYRVFELAAWIDYFENQERLLYDSLAMVNECERHGVHGGTAVGCAGLGLLFGAVCWERLARYYLQRALRLGSRIDHPAAMGLALVGLATIEENATGGVQRAATLVERAAQLFEKIGDLRGWGLATWQLGFMTLRRGQFDYARYLLDEVARVAADAGDRQMQGWALHDLGLLRMCTTGPADAVAPLEKAVALLSEVRDPLSMAVAKAYLAQAQARLGLMQAAVSNVGDANRIIDAHGFPRAAYPARNARAEVEIRIAEARRARVEAPSLAEARRACRSARAIGRRVRDGAAEAWRLQGSVDWIGGRRWRARRAWGRSLAVAADIALPYEAARTRAEIGRLTGDRASLAQAAHDFEALGAHWDASQARALVDVTRAQ